MNRHQPRTSFLRPARIARPAVYFEALESRQLLSATFAVAVTSVKLPDHPVTGAIVKGSALLSLTNTSVDAALASAKADIHISAHPHDALDASTDIPIGSLLKQSINIAASLSKPFTVHLTIPANTPAEEYDLVVTFTQPAPDGSLIATTTSADAFTQEAPNLDLHTTLGTPAIPTPLVAGGTVVGTLPLVLTNDGNIASAATEKTTLQLFARPVEGGAGPDIPLSTVAPLTNLATGNMKPGAVKTVTAKVIFPLSVTTGNYVIVATATTTGPTPENNAGNNTAAGNQTLQVTQGFLDFSTTFVSSKMPAPLVLGSPGAASIQLNVTNIGNIPTSATDKVTFTVVAHPMGGGADVPLKTVAGQSVAKLGALNGFKPFTIPIAFTKDMLAGTYQIVVTTTADGPGSDTNTSNDSFTLVDTLTIAPAFVDLSVLSASTTLSGSVVGGTASTATVTLKNLGNIASTGYLVEIFATTDGTIPGGTAPIGSLASPTAKIIAGGTLILHPTFTLPSVVSNTAYTLVARVTLAGDTNAVNNTGTLGTLTVTPTPPVLGNLPNSVTFIEQTNNPISVPGLGVVQTTTTGDVSHPGHPLPQGDFYHYSTFNAPGETKKGRMVLAVSPNGEINLVFTFTGTRLTSLSAKTITFMSTATGSSGSFVVVGDSILAGVTDGQTGFFKVT